MAVEPIPFNDSSLLPASMMAILALRMALIIILGISSSLLASEIPATISFTAIVEALLPPGPPPMPSQTVTRYPKGVFCHPEESWFSGLPPIRDSAKAVNSPLSSEYIFCSSISYQISN